VSFSRKQLFTSSKTIILLSFISFFLKPLQQNSIASKANYENGCLQVTKVSDKTSNSPKEKG